MKGILVHSRAVTSKDDAGLRGCFLPFWARVDIPAELCRVIRLADLQSMPGNRQLMAVRTTQKKTIWIRGQLIARINCSLYF